MPYEKVLYFIINCFIFFWLVAFYWAKPLLIVKVKMAADGGRLALGGHACQFKLSEMNDRRRRQQRLAILKPIAGAVYTTSDDDDL